MEMRRGVYKFSQDPIDPGCECYTCRSYTRSYLHHLIKAKEVLGWKLIAGHNLHFYHQLMRGMREAVLADTFYEFYLQWRPILERTDSPDEDAPKVAPKAPLKPKTKPLELGNYFVNINPEGFATVKQRSSGEIMHPIGAPEEEVRKIYIEQSNLAARLQDTSKPSELVLWDVGLGAGTNAMAAIRAYEGSTGPLRPMSLVSFEIDLDAMKLAMAHPHLFPHVKHSGPTHLLEKKQWISKKSPGLKWTLCEGDFLEWMSRAPLPEVVFFDPFSYKTDEQLWTLQTFQKLFSLVRDHATSLFTYSNSTAVRAALLAAGFYVAKGCATGPKAATTIALTPLARAENLSRYETLGAEWLTHWERSGAKLPPHFNPEQVGGIGADHLEQLIRSHEQFKITS
jgi:queuine tRNA-ribosyltransferase